MEPQDQKSRSQGLGSIDFWAMFRGHCPRCHQGSVFWPLFSRHPLQMHPRCTECGLEFEREPGYFVGAMYFSYTFGVAAVVPLALILLLIFHVAGALVIGIALLQTIATMVLSFRYARIAWLYLDQALDPR